MGRWSDGRASFLFAPGNRRSFMLTSYIPNRAALFTFHGKKRASAVQYSDYAFDASSALNIIRRSDNGLSTNIQTCLKVKVHATLT